MGLKGQPTRLAEAPAVACEGDKALVWRMSHCFGVKCLVRWERLEMGGLG